MMINLFTSIIVIIFIWTESTVLARECRIKDACICEFDDGTGSGFDLRHVVDPDDYYLQTRDPMTQDLYYFHPCSNIQYLPQNATKNNDCNKGEGYAMCRFNNASSTYQNLGTATESSFRSSENGHHYLVFKHNSTTTSIRLICTVNDKSYIYHDDENIATGNSSEKNLILFSRYSCPVTIEEIVQSSVGKILLILFFIASFTYFTIGSIVRFMYLGARGIEVVPHLDFWKNLPGLVRDGAKFIQNGCRVERDRDPDSYDAI